MDSLQEPPTAALPPGPESLSLRRYFRLVWRDGAHARLMWRAGVSALRWSRCDHLWSCACVKAGDCQQRGPTCSQTDVATGTVARAAVCSFTCWASSSHLQPADEEQLEDEHEHEQHSWDVPSIQNLLSSYRCLSLAANHKRSPHWPRPHRL